MSVTVPIILAGPVPRSMISRAEKYWFRKFGLDVLRVFTILSI